MKVDILLSIYYACKESWKKVAKVREVYFQSTRFGSANIVANINLKITDCITDFRRRYSGECKK